MMAAFALSGCARSHNQIWDDTKTCKRYMGKGLRSLFGEHVDAREYARFYESWEEEPEFVALRDSDAELNRKEVSMAHAKESPGDPGSKIPGIDGFSSPLGQLAHLFSNVQFETDQYSVSGRENLQTLKEIAGYLSKHPSTYIFIEGHADERGAAAYNLALGSRRANSVRSFLIQNGVNPNQLFTISFGKEKPLAQGHNEPIWAKNRRAQFRLHEKK